MAVTYTQIAETPGALDFPVHNYGATDIAAHRVVAIDATYPIADGSTYDSIGVEYPTLGGAVQTVFGVSTATISAGANGTVRCGGIAIVKCHGAVTINTFVEATVTAGHEGEVRTHTAGAHCGIALMTGADGDEIPILLSVAPNA